MHLTHKEIIEIVKSLKYLSNKAGLCRAISIESDFSIIMDKLLEHLAHFDLMSELLGKDQSREQRIKNIESGIIAKKINEAKERIKLITEKLKANPKNIERETLLSDLEKCKKIIEVEAICQNIALAFFPHEYSMSDNVFEVEIGNVNREMAEETVFKLLQPKILEDEGGIMSHELPRLILQESKYPLQEIMSKINGYFWIFNKFIREVEEIKEQKNSAFPPRIALSIGGPNHRISASLQEKKNKITLIDSNLIQIPMVHTEPYSIGKELIGSEDDSVFKLAKGRMGTTLEFKIRILKNKDKIIQPILEKYFSQLSKCNQNWLPAHFAAENGDINMLIELKESPAHYILKNSAGNSPIHIAIGKENWNVSAYFLMNIPEHKKIEASDIKLLNEHSKKIITGLFEWMETLSPELQKNILTSILQKENALGQLFIPTYEKEFHEKLINVQIISKTTDIDQHTAQTSFSKIAISGLSGITEIKNSGKKHSEKSSESITIETTDNQNSVILLHDPEKKSSIHETTSTITEELLNAVINAFNTYIKINHMQTIVKPRFFEKYRTHGLIGKENAERFLANIMNMQISDPQKMYQFICKYLENGPGKFGENSFKTILIQELYKVSEFSLPASLLPSSKKTKEIN